MRKCRTDIDAVESGEKYTALHFAARDQRREIVEALLKAGAKVDVRDAKGKTPLRHCLSNSKRDPAIVEMLEAHGAEAKKPAQRKSAAKAAAGKKKENALSRAPAAKKKTQGALAGVAGQSSRAKKVLAESSGARSKSKSRVLKTSNELKGDWTAEFNRLWKKLVPRKGRARTLQGEMIRLTGRLSDEAFRNGNINWSADHEEAWKFVRETLHDESVFSRPVLFEIARHVRWILRHKTSIPTEIVGSPYDELARRAVEWCLAHSRPMPLKSGQSRYSI